MNELTVIILSRSDEDVVGEAIESVKSIAHEIIVIDSNNDNKTELIARKAGARVVKHTFKNFSDQRNYAILHATTPWVLYLDSDERATPEFCRDVQRIIKQYQDSGEIGGYYVKRKTFYFGHDWNFEDKVQRLFVRSRFVEWKGVVHESPKIRGEFGLVDAPIIHLTHRNLSQMIRKTNEWSEYEARLRFESNHPRMVPWRFIRVMGTEFVNSYINNKGYKNGTYGLIEAVYQAFSIFISYAKLWEMQEAGGQKHHR